MEEPAGQKFHLIGFSVGCRVYWRRSPCLPKQWNSVGCESRKGLSIPPTKDDVESGSANFKERHISDVSEVALRSASKKKCLRGCKAAWCCRRGLKPLGHVQSSKISNTDTHTHTAPSENPTLRYHPTVSPLPVEPVRNPQQSVLAASRVLSQPRRPYRRRLRHGDRYFLFGRPTHTSAGESGGWVGMEKLYPYPAVIVTHGYHTSAPDPALVSPPPPKNRQPGTQILLFSTYSRKS